jgi:hypothetical protein
MAMHSKHALSLLVFMDFSPLHTFFKKFDRMMPSYAAFHTDSLLSVPPPPFPLPPAAAVIPARSIGGLCFWPTWGLKIITGHSHNKTLMASDAKWIRTLATGSGGLAVYRPWTMF